MQLSKLLLLAVAGSAFLGLAQADNDDSISTPVLGGPVGSQAGAALAPEQPQTGVELEVAKQEAFLEAETFAVGDEIMDTGLVISEDSEDPEVVEIAEDPDFIEEEKLKCCPEGSFCCGMELGCIPDALAPDVMCPVKAADSPATPCCTRRLF